MVGMGNNSGYSMSCHVVTDDFAIGMFVGGFMNDVALGYNQDTVREFQNLIQVLRDKQHGGAAVARLHDSGSDFGNGFEI